MTRKRMSVKLSTFSKLYLHTQRSHPVYTPHRISLSLTKTSTHLPQSQRRRSNMTLATAPRADPKTSSHALSSTSKPLIGHSVLQSPRQMVRRVGAGVVALAEARWSVDAKVCHAPRQHGVLKPVRAHDAPQATSLISERY